VQYEGEFADGKEQGHGVWTRTIKYAGKGKKKARKSVGSGGRNSSQGGGAAVGVKNAEGEMVSVCVYEGPWFNGKMHGATGRMVFDLEQEDVWLSYQVHRERMAIYT
jgi:hypothetical protein